MKPFHFQKFSIFQSKDVFRVGTDAVLLGALSNLENKNVILEVGTGTGIISLMLAQRNLSAIIDALDIDEKAFQLSSQNFSESVFRERMTSFLMDFKEFNLEKKYDFIVSNPPYFESNPSEKDILARQKISLNFENLVQKSAELLTDEGMLSVIIPSDFSLDFICFAEENSLFLEKKINIYGIEGGVFKRNILEFSKKQKRVEILDFVIEKSPRKYSDQYLQATEDFHVFN